MKQALDLELIRTFVTVLEEGGLKLAASKLHKTPSAVSMQIKRLEEALGQRVLERSNQGLSLTFAGEKLKRKGQKLLALNYELLGEMAEADIEGQLRFGSPADYTPTILQKLIPIFQREFPNVSPSIILEPSRALRARVEAGDLDLAIVASEPHRETGHLLWSEEVAWYGNAVTPEGNPRYGILATNCVLRERSTREIELLGGEHMIALEAATVDSLREAVEAGFCQSFLPSSSSHGLDRSETMVDFKPMNLQFSLIFGSTFDKDNADRISSRLHQALND
ncbi:LysR family transcriptional regulator [Curvivirga aplysinae]|uniref:LysR family transcriptional regulator n=1 Tax=Curvivirga aplysinae TaxID=2529852 RepID=UPI0012BC51B7|nr:LysR family transcriptional regulator [Curvivirga aplysinae]MTI09436.1 LysR family transcriptional regulator [Curvivirga aplysinae]